MPPSQKDINDLKQAIFKDYGVKLSDEDARESANNLRQLLKALIKVQVKHSATPKTQKELSY